MRPSPASKKPIPTTLAAKHSADSPFGHPSTRVGQIGNTPVTTSPLARERQLGLTTTYVLAGSSLLTLIVISFARLRCGIA